MYSLTVYLGFPYYDIEKFIGQERSWSSQIKKCMKSCKTVLNKGNKDMNYCIEGCRIRIYRPIYSCVYEQCNNRGLGVNHTEYPTKYHHCVHLCKLRPRNVISHRNSYSYTTQSPFTPTYEYHYSSRRS